MKQLKLFLFTIVLTVFAGNKNFAQTTQASISGIILGSNSEPVKDAMVQIRNESTGFKINSLSNIKGAFTFKELPLGGPYTINVTALGYGEQ